MNDLKNVYIAGTGSFLPEKVLTNQDLGKIVNTTDGWITERTGIKERRIAGEGVFTSDMGTGAAIRALEMANTKPSEVDFIICATITADNIFPNAAAQIQRKLYAVNAGAVDVSAACSGFLYALVIGKQMVATGLYNNVLVIGAEKLSVLTDYQDRNTCILFGDGAGAALLKESKNENSKIIYSSLYAQGTTGTPDDVVVVPAGGCRIPASVQSVNERLHFMRMKGREIYKFVVSKFIEMVEDATKKCNLSLQDIDFIVPHQVNLRIIEAAASRVNIPLEKFVMNIDKYGNTSSASVPLALDELVRSDKVKRGKYILLVAFGAGLTWGSVLLKW